MQLMEMNNMHCPNCGKRLYKLADGEYVCHNDDCPANKRNFKYVHAEYYGNTQTEINKQIR